MSDVGFILGGALQGIGSGIVAQGQANAAREAEAAKETAAMRREIVLENLRNQNAMARDTAQNENAMKRDTAQSGLKKDENAQSADLQDRNAARATQRNTASQITIDKAKTQNDMALARLRSSLSINEQQAKSASDLANSLAMAGQEVSEFKVGPDGTLVAYSKTGKILAQSKPGQFVPDHTNGTTGFSGFGAPGLPGSGSAAPQKPTVSNW